MRSASESYLICGVPRSGTTLLCQLLASTGVAGRPDEYFWHGEPLGRNDARISDYERYVAHVIDAGTTPNGVFGAKVMWGYLDDVLARLRSLPGRERLADRSLLESVFPRLQFIWMRREDVVAQAVSWARAIQTNRWHYGDDRDPHGEPVFDFDQIHALAGEAERHTTAWERWFAANGVEPLAITYEALVAEKAAVARRALDFLGLTVPEDAVTGAPTPKQADSLNEDWIRRYRTLLERGAEVAPPGARLR